MAENEALMMVFRVFKAAGNQSLAMRDLVAQTGKSESYLRYGLRLGQRLGEIQHSGAGRSVVYRMVPEKNWAHRIAAQRGASL